jgi:hypothetical protein
MRRTIAALAAVSGAALVVTPGVAFAETTPAVDATASAVAAQVGDILAVGQTSAKAGQSEMEATANALAIGGAPLSEQFGGSTKSTGSSKKSGQLLDTGSTPLGRLQVTPWEAATEPKDGCRTASSRAALARVTLVDEETLHLNVLQSQSDASHCGATSTGKGSSDGATLNLGGDALALVLLHSEADSSNAGSTFLLSLNGNEIVTGEQAGGQCALEVPGLLGLTCLAVGGGEGTVFSDVAKLVVGDGALTGSIVGSQGTGTKEPQVLPTAIDNGGAAAPAPADGVQSGALARTGTELGAMALVGGMLVALGAATRRRFRRA